MTTATTSTGTRVRPRPFDVGLNRSYQVELAICGRAPEFEYLPDGSTFRPDVVVWRARSSMGVEAVAFELSTCRNVPLYEPLPDWCPRPAGRDAEILAEVAGSQIDEALTDIGPGRRGDRYQRPGSAS